METNEYKESGIRRSLSTPYKSKLDELNQKVKPVLGRTTNTLINFTDHSLDHSLGVENVYDILLDKEYDLLTEDEKFLLIAATLLHDIGMVGQQADLGRQDYEAYRRNAHNYFSKERIVTEADVLGLDFTEAKLIADIAEAHRKVPLDSLQQEVSYGLGTVVRLRLLGAMLRFADELHVTKGRTSKLLMNVLEPDEFSMKHHKRHENVHGVSRMNSNRNLIVISANADDWEMEELMEEMVTEIKAKLTQVNELFLENKIIISDVLLNLHCEDLVTKEIFLALAEKPHTEQEINEVLNKREKSIIKKILGTFRTTGILEFDTSNGQYKLTASEDTCRKVFNSLKNTDYIFKFISLPYLRGSIGEIFDDIAYRIYSHRIFHGDREDRLLLIRNSPTVLDNLLNEKQMDPNFAQLNRSVVLDLLILNGYMQDVSKKPSLSKEDEIIFAMENIQNSLHKELGSFLSLVQHLDPEKLEVSKDVLDQQVKKKK
ncbi:HD domain-containing protein [Rossellomorea vietnamensis]|uniref:HD domain-containing protein n=1 Tax=Rossellomorea vietnamensis TaxID=218284 RepID=UPI001653DBB9|nr:HD domain-containing protein [Rossellomorea vietnamensis]